MTACQRRLRLWRPYSRRRRRPYHCRVGTAQRQRQPLRWERTEFMGEKAPVLSTDRCALCGEVFQEQRLPQVPRPTGQPRKRVWDAAPKSPIAAADVDAVLPDVREELDLGFFYGRWEKATAKERDYMRGMAASGTALRRHLRSWSGLVGREPLGPTSTTRFIDQEGPDLRTRPRSCGLHSTAVRRLRPAELPDESERWRMTTRHAVATVLADGS